MDPEAVQTQEAPLTVNEQVIVMSSHETIRVLEVGVDAPPPAEEDRKPSEMPPGDGARGSPRGSSDPGREEVPPSTETSCSTEAAGKTKPAAGASPSSGPPSGTFGHAASQQPQPLAPLAAPQVLTQENLATVVTGVMVPAGTVTQPLLIPISIAGQVAGQQGLAVWTFPTATVAALPGLTAASPTGGIFKPPIANLQVAAVLNTVIPAPVQPAQPLPAAVQPRPPLQPQSVFPPVSAVPSQPPILPQPAAAPTPPVAKPLEPQTQLAAVQPAGFAFNPGIVRSRAAPGPCPLPFPGTRSQPRFPHPRWMLVPLRRPHGQPAEWLREKNPRIKDWERPLPITAARRGPPCHGGGRSDPEMSGGPMGGGRAAPSPCPLTPAFWFSADQRRLPGGANAAPQLPGGRPRDRQHHLQRAGHHGADPHQRPGPGDRDPAVGGEPPRHRGCQPGAGPEPAGAGGDAPAAAQCPGPGDRHAGQRHHPSGRHQEKRPPRAPHQERGAAHPAGPSSAAAGRGHRQPCAGGEGGLSARPHHLLRDTHRQPAGGQAPGPQQRRGGGRHQPGGDPGVRQELQDPAPVPRPDADPGGTGPDGHRGPCLQPVGHLQVREARHHPQERPEAEAGAGEVAERGRAAQPGGAAEPDGVRGGRALQEAQAPDVLHAAGHRGAQRPLREERAAHRPGDHRDRQGAQLRPRSRPRVVLQPPTDAQKHQQTQRLSDPLRKGGRGGRGGGPPMPGRPPRAPLSPLPDPSLLPSALCDRLSPAPGPSARLRRGARGPPKPRTLVSVPPSRPTRGPTVFASRVPRGPVTCVVPDPRLHSPCPWVRGGPPSPPFHVRSPPPLQE